MTTDHHTAFCGLCSNENTTPPQISDTESREQTTALVGQNEGKALGSKRPVVCFELFRTRLLDADAKWSSVKDLLDGLQYAGLIHGDREDQIQLIVEQHKVSKRIYEHTTIEIDYPQ